MNTPLAAWNVSPDDFPADGTSEEKLWFAVRYAILAPSTHNTQPWLFQIHGNVLELYADLTRALPVVDPDHRELIISCGAALFHLRLAIRYFGYSSRVETFPEPADSNLLARLHLGFKDDTEAADILLFNAIPKRRTNRLEFRNEAVPTALLSVLCGFAAQEGAWLKIVEGEEARYAVADLVAEADRIQWAGKPFRRELAAWLHPNRADASDGIPGYAQGPNGLPAYAGPMVIKTFDLGKRRSSADWDVALYSPVLAVLGTDANTPQDWLQTGQALANLLLRARVEDVWASYLNQPIELPELRPRLAELIKPGSCPQILLRLGFGDEVKPTPRRPVQEVILKSQQHTIALTPA
jgi:nitroreductase